MSERQKLLEDLMELKRPIKDVRAALSAYPWDSDTELAILASGHISQILRRCVTGNIDAHEVEDWANAIECRDDIELTPGAASFTNWQIRS